MISNFAWRLRDLLKKVWVRVVGYALLAVVAAGLARALAPLIGEDTALQAGADAVQSLLGVLTSSMLAVTTFSLSIAVSAFAAAAESATPRATVLLQQDRTTQNVLSTFLGAFLFGLIGLIALHAEVYGPSGRVVMFAFTVMVFGLVVVALIRWIDHLMTFGRMRDTLERVEKAASKALRARLRHPFLGGRRLDEAPPHAGAPVAARKTGYVQHLDMKALQSCAEAAGAQVVVRRLPGAFVAAGAPLLRVHPQPDDDAMDDLRRAVVLSPARTFEDDPRFGLIVLTEIASRALSPAVNDPGTAIEILGRHVRIIAEWRDRRDAEVSFDRVFVPAITLDDLFEDAFRPIARDGAPLAEVMIRFQKALASLHHVAPAVFADACARMSLEAVARAEAAELLPLELEAIRAAAPPGAHPGPRPETDSPSAARTWPEGPDPAGRRA